MARPKDTNKKQLTSRNKNSLEMILDWIKSNPGDAALLLAQSVGMDPRPPWMREKQDPKDLAGEAGLLAAGVVPVAGPAARVGAKVTKVTKKAKEAQEVAEKAAGMRTPKLSTPKAGGSGTGQAAGGANRLSAREAAAKARGRKRARTEKGAKELEAQEAKDAGRTSINTGKASPVQIREGAEGPKLPSGITDKQITAFVNKRSKSFTKPRTKAEKERAAEEVKKRLEIARKMREDGRPPGADVPDKAGNLPVGNPARTSSAKPKPKKPGTSQKAADRKKFTEKVKRDKTVKARKEQIEKDVREGRRQSVTDPRSYPSKGQGAEGPKASQGLVSTGRGSTTREAIGRRTPSNLPAARGRGEVVQGEVVSGGRGTGAGGRDPIDLKTRPVRKPIGAIGSGRTGTTSAGAGGGQVPRAIGSGAKATGKNKMGRGKKALLGLGAMAAGGAALSTLDSDKAPGDSGGKPSTTSTSTGPKPKNRPTLRDKYGRDITREEFAKREAYRQRVASMTPEQAAKARKAEMKRRRDYRSGAGNKRFGSGASTKTRNIRDRKGYAYMDMAARRNMR